MEHEGAGGDAGSARDNENSFRFFVEQRRQVAEHALQAHVGGQRRGLYIAGAVKAANACRRQGHGDRHVHAFADVGAVNVLFAADRNILFIDHARNEVLGPGRHLPPVGDDTPGNGGNSNREPDGAC